MTHLDEYKYLGLGCMQFSISGIYDRIDITVYMCVRVCNSQVAHSIAIARLHNVLYVLGVIYVHIFLSCREWLQVVLHIHTSIGNHLIVMLPRSPVRCISNNVEMANSCLNLREYPFLIAYMSMLPGKSYWWKHHRK